MTAPVHAHADWPRDEFGHPKRIWDMGPTELDRAAQICRAELDATA